MLPEAVLLPVPVSTCACSCVPLVRGGKGEGFLKGPGIIDQAKILVRGGGGGDGCVSFRREKFVPRGGPNGGDGGDGGDVIVESTASVRTLLDLHYHPLNVAERGVHGKGKDMHGKRGKDRVMRVPVGTICKDADTDEVLWDFQHEDERLETLADYLLREQMSDGGWNCQRDYGATHSSVHTTISVLEGLRLYELH